jgi:AcrR family transcriptional regulator
VAGEAIVRIVEEAAPRAKRNRPGRPEGPSHVRDGILDAAEEIFANAGYAGTSLRDVADKAQVTQALVNYYFGSKKGLFIEVYLRRGRELVSQRMQRLEELLRTNPTPEVRDIVRAFISPAFEMRRSRGGHAFIRLQARLHTEPEAFAYDLRRQVYDESTRAYADVLVQRLPHLATKTIYWRLIQFIGAYLYVISDAHRLEEISGGRCAPGVETEAQEQLVAFIAGGLLAAEPN